MSKSLFSCPELLTSIMCRNPLKFKSIECNLLERGVAADGGRRRENRGSQTEEEDEV